MNLLRVLVAVLTPFFVMNDSILNAEPSGSAVISMESIEAEVMKLMDQGDIPGLSLFMINGEDEFFRNYGWQDASQTIPVNVNTQFQIGSCSKAFTGLAVTRLVSDGKLQLTDLVSAYLPWFQVSFEGEEQQITIGQLLYHTSGIPWNTLSDIPETDKEDALESTVRTLIGQELEELPGEEYEYATINYDVLALIIQEVTEVPFETYLEKHVFDPLMLTRTSIGYASDSTRLADGHKNSFYSAKPYLAPVYRGNNAAGYIISDITDMSRWLKFQMGQIESDLYTAAQFTHQRDESVGLHGVASYAGGWNVSLNGSGQISHEGFNPNYTAYVAFRPKSQIGVVVLANSSSNFTAHLGNKVMRMLDGEVIEREFIPGDGGDGAYSSLSIAIGVYILVLLGYLSYVFTMVAKGKRTYKPLNVRTLGKFLGSLLMVVPFLGGLYLLPDAIAGFSWESIQVWSPYSFVTLIQTFLVALAASYLASLVGLLFPDPHEYRKKGPMILLLSILSGLANVVIIIMVTSAGNSDLKFGYILLYYGLVMSVYLLGRRYVQVNLITITRKLVYDLRIQLTEKIFSTTYHKFEKIGTGRVHTALNDDVNTIGQSTSLFLTLITSVITAVGAFIYMASIALWATTVTLSLILVLSVIYYLVSTRTDVYFEEARDERNIFMSLISGLIHGYKEISLSRSKKLAYRDDVAQSADAFREKTTVADVRFVNAFLIGEFLLVGLLGFVAFGIPEFFKNVEFYTVIGFVVVLLYLIGPINSILSSIPSLMRLKVSWKRIHGFINEIPASIDISEVPEATSHVIDRFEVRNICFSYGKDESDHAFGVGPLNLEVNAGEIVFIVGGNGSGKTTMAKLITGLYEADSGQLFVNDQQVRADEIGQYYSVAFTPPYLFEKLYNIEQSTIEEKSSDYLNLLELDHKVTIEGNQYSSIELSGGQRKRLALLQCMLEDSPIYLFDEWAADQDPEYRKFFYQKILPDMRASGKMVIAITHDDQYFDIADKVYKMNEGHLDVYEHPSMLESLA